MDINKRKQEVQWLLTSGNLESGIKRAMDFIKDFGNTQQTIVEVVELSHQFNTQKINDTLTDESRRAIAFNVIKLLDEAEQDFFKIQRLAKNNEEVIILRGIDKAFPTNRFHLKNVDAEFKLGEITGIVEPKLGVVYLVFMRACSIGKIKLKSQRERNLEIENTMQCQMTKESSSIP